MSLYLAIDAGGTKTTCLLADETTVLARASTGTVKLMRVSEEEATQRLQSMLEEVSIAARVSLEKVTRTCFGLAGSSSPAVRTWARQILPAMVSGDFILCGDEEIALDAAFQGGPGILVIAGTGSNIVGRDVTGKLHSAGGWGPVLGDEGSGYWIGLHAIRAALRERDRIDFGGIPSCLLREIEFRWKLASTAELVAFANQRPGPDFAELAPVVARCALDGDLLAARILQQAGNDLADQVALVARKLSAQGSGPTAATAPSLGVAYTGSVLSHIRHVRAAMVAALHLSTPAAHVLDTPADSLEGALWRARHPPPRSQD